MQVSPDFDPDAIPDMKTYLGAEEHDVDTAPELAFAGVESAIIIEEDEEEEEEEQTLLVIEPHTCECCQWLNAQCRVLCAVYRHRVHYKV